MVGLLHKVWECRTRQGSLFSIRQQLQVASLSEFVITYRGGQSCFFVGASIYTLARLWRPIGFWSSSLIPKILAQLLLCRHLEEINKDLSCFKSPGRDKPSTWNKRNINHWTSLFQQCSIWMVTYSWDYFSLTKNLRPWEPPNFTPQKQACTKMIKSYK